MSPISKKAWPALVDRATLALAALAGLFLLFLVGLVFVAVLLRYVAQSPILGINEIVQLVAVAIVMLALPWCTDRNGHVRADVFDSAIGRAGRFSGDLFSRCVSTFVLSVLVYRSWLKLLDAREFEDVTNMLSLPIWPFYGMMVAGMGLCVFVMVLQIAVILMTGEEMK